MLCFPPSHQKKKEKKKRSINVVSRFSVPLVHGKKLWVCSIFSVQENLHIYSISQKYISEEFLVLIEKKRSIYD